MRVEIRNDSVIIEGYVNVTLRESRELSSPKGPFVEEILPKTFERALHKTDSVDLLFNHDKNRKLGSTKTGELSLGEDSVGLRAVATVKDPDVMDKAKKGELRGWSFAFSSVNDTWKAREDGMQKRSISELDLYEVSILDCQPAYIATSLEVRGDESNVLTEVRTEDSQAKIIDNSDKTEDKQEKIDETKKNEENKETLEPYYFEHLEKELTLMKV